MINLLREIDVGSTIETTRPALALPYLNALVLPTQIKKIDLTELMINLLREIDVGSTIETTRPPLALPYLNALVLPTQIKKK